MRPQAEDDALGEVIVRELKRRDAQGTASLCKRCLGENPEDRRRFERVLQGLVSEGRVRLQPDSFEKDGRVIHFKRAALVRGGSTPGRRVHF